MQLIEAVDTTPPVLTCPPDVTVECGSPSDPSATGTATATDACDANITITFGDALRLMKNTAGVAMTGCTVGAPIERTWTATDACGNVSTCVQHIQTVDVTPPALTCPPNTVVECGQPFDPTATGTATATDACGSDITITFGDAQRLVKNAGPVTAGCVARPPIDRTWTATDACGNSSTCVQTIEFKDTTAPVVTCPADVTIECSQSTDPSSTGTPTSHDVCDANITITFGDALRLVKGAGAVTQDCTTSGSDIIRTWTFTDACGNTSQCVQTIHIADNTACPRSPGFWRAQCDQAPTGQTKFDAAHMEAISARADQQAATFSWPSGGAFSGLCSALSTGGNMTTRRQAKRQFAAFLANIAVGQLGYVGNNGDVVSLGLSTPVSCSGLSSTTVGALLSEIDSRLVALESQSLQNSAVKNEYSHISACLDPINNGKAFTNVCSASLVENALYPADNLLGVDDAAAGSMRRPTPNPFSSTTRLSYAIPASGLPLHVGVYDISGRLVTTLADGESKAGSLELAWNGRDTSGNPVNGGVYFIRARVGSVEQSMRVVFLKP